jgi:GntR family transcriptional regulator
MGSPMYRQIAEDLRQQIDSGKLKPGEQLWTEIELRERYGASRNTIRDAVKWLINLGLVETRPGQGTFVARKMNPYVTTLTADPKASAGDSVVGPDEGDRYAPEVKAQSREPSSSEPQVEIQKASAAIASQLGIAEGDYVVSRHQRRSIDGTPWSLQTSFYPRELTVRGAERLSLAENIPEGVVRYLADSLGLRQVGYRDWITVRTANPTEAAFFNLTQDGRVGVFEISRTAFDQNGTPIRLTVTVYPTDRNHFVINVGEVPQPSH